MKRNIGAIDRTIRIIAGLALLGLAAAGTTKWGLLGIVPLATGLIGWCPPYSVLGISTCKCEKSDSDKKCACPSKH